MNSESKTTQKVHQNGQRRVARVSKQRGLALVLMSILLLSSQATYAHCDSYDGPVIQDAFKALETNKVQLVLKWVNEDQEADIKALFEKTYKLRKGDQEIYQIVEKHFLETLVRLHRETEGAPYTGLKPAGSASPIVKMADLSIVNQNVDELASKFTAHIEKVVRDKYEKVKELSAVKNESLELGRAYVSAYVDYTHMLEGIHAILEHSSDGHATHKHE